MQDPKAPKVPAFATGSIDLRVPPQKYQLRVKVLPEEDVLEPGGETTVTVKVHTVFTRIFTEIH